MSFFSKTKKQSRTSNNTSDQVFLGDNFDSRLNWLKQSFNLCSDITIYEINPNHTRVGIVYLTDMVDQKLFDEQVLTYIVSEDFASSHKEFLHKLLELKMVSTMASSIHTDMQQAVQLVLDGNILIFFEGDIRMLAFS